MSRVLVGAALALVTAACLIGAALTAPTGIGGVLGALCAAATGAGVVFLEAFAAILEIVSRTDFCVVFFKPHLGPAVTYLNQDSTCKALR
jgi:hypothetical protein